MLLLALATGLVLVAAAATTSMLRPEGRLDAGITLGVLASAEVVAIDGISGALGWLKPGVVLAATAVWAATSVGLARWRGPSPSALDWRHLSFPSPRDGLVTVRTNPWVAAVVGLAVVALMWQMLVAFVLPPFAYDALTYHLTIVATWIQHGNLDPPALSLCCRTYPLNPELIFAWPMLLQGSDTLVDAVQIPFAVLASLAVAGLARSAGLSAAAAAAASGLFVVTPIVLTQSSSNFVDVIVAAWVLAALHSLVRFGATRVLRRLVPAGLASGLLLGTKGTGVIWGVTLIAIGLGLLVWAAKRHGLPAATAVRGAATFLLSSLALGTYWYARNWITTGNPVHPFLVEVGGRTIFDGPVRMADVLTVPPGGPNEAWPVSVLRSWVADVAFWRQGPYDYQQRRGGLGPLWPWLGLPLLLPFTLGLLRRRRPALLAVVAVAVVFVVQPYRWWSRFTIPLAALGVMAIVAAASTSRPWTSRVVRAAALGLAVAGVALSSYEVDPASRARPLAAADLLGLIGAPAQERTVGRVFFPEYRFVEEIPEDATVVVDLLAEPVRFVYPLFGPLLKRRVLPSDDASPPAGAWAVTAAGRPLDSRLMADPRFVLASDVGGVRAWRPRLGPP